MTLITSTRLEIFQHTYIQAATDITLICGMMNTTRRYCGVFFAILAPSIIKLLTFLLTYFVYTFAKLNDSLYASLPFDRSNFWPNAQIGLGLVWVSRVRFRVRVISWTLRHRGAMRSIWPLAELANHV